MPTTFRRLESEALDVPVSVMRELGWTLTTPIDVQRTIAWTDAPDGTLCRCLVFTLTRAPKAPKTPRANRSLRKAA